MAEKRVSIGIDLGGTGIKTGIVSGSHEILAKSSIPTRAERPHGEVIDDMAREAERLLRENGYSMEDCVGIGVGCPGTIEDETGTVLYSNNIRWEHVPLAGELRRQLALPDCREGGRGDRAFPIRVSNDANCAALGEVLNGAAKGCRNAVFLTLGTGVGGGIVIDGRLFTGGHPGGAEPGHIKAGAEGRICTCGRRDCLETYASATALIADAKRAAACHPESVLWELCGNDLEHMNAKLPFDAAEAGDVCGRELVAKYIRSLADGIVDLANLFRPDLIVIGGGVSAQGERLTEPLNRYLARECFGAPLTCIPRVVTALHGNDTGIIGAAGLVSPESPGTEPAFSPYTSERHL